MTGYDGKPFSDELVSELYESLGMPVEPTVSSVERSSRVTTQNLADVVPERVSWLWPGRLPAGKLVVLDGDPGVGKSTLSLEIASHVTTGSPWPDRTYAQTGAVVLLSAEDGLADTIRPRLDAAGADPSRVTAITGIPQFGEDEHLIGERPPHLGDLDRIREVIVQTGAVLLVVDVLMAYLPSQVDAHRDQDVRGVLHRLAQMAEDLGCCVLLLRHMNKSAGGSPLYRGGGSIGIVGAARAGFVAARDPEDETLVVLAPTKSNLAVMPPAIGYRLVEHPNGAARIVWTGVVDRKAVDLLAPAGPTSSRDQLEQLLLEYVSGNGGRVKAIEAMAYAKEAGYTERTIHRAREKAGITTKKSGMGGPWVWLMPGEDAKKNAKLSGLGVLAGSASSDAEMASSEPRSMLCTVCGTVLDKALIRTGTTEHPACSPYDGTAS